MGDLPRSENLTLRRHTRISPAQDAGGSQNQSPAIAGSPPLSILQGDVFGFSPVASDADGDTLTFWIGNKPAWASFQTTTGVLYGVPASEDLGLYTGIQIWVTDGQAWAALPAFDIDVLSADLPSVRLSWEPPTINSDGSMLARNGSNAVASTSRHRPWC